MICTTQYYFSRILISEQTWFPQGLSTPFKAPSCVSLWCPPFSLFSHALCFNVSAYLRAVFPSRLYTPWGKGPSLKPQCLPGKRCSINIGWVWIKKAISHRIFQWIYFASICYWKIFLTWEIPLPFRFTTISPVGSFKFRHTLACSWHGCLLLCFWWSSFPINAHLEIFLRNLRAT